MKILTLYGAYHLYSGNGYWWFTKLNAMWFIEEQNKHLPVFLLYHDTWKNGAFKKIRACDDRDIEYYERDNPIAVGMVT